MRRIERFGIAQAGHDSEEILHQLERSGYPIVKANPFSPSSEEQVFEVERPADIAMHLPSPRLLFLFAPSTTEAEDLTDELAATLQADDIILDCSASHWSVTQKRAMRLRRHDIELLDCQVQLLPSGLSFMVSGALAAFEAVETFLHDLATADQVTYIGSSGSAHFVRQVYRGIEFSIMQVIGEGMDVLSNFQQKLDLKELLESWNYQNSLCCKPLAVISENFDEHLGFSHLKPQMEDTEEIVQLLRDALKMEVPTPMLAQAITQMLALRPEQHLWNRTLSARWSNVQSFALADELIFPTDQENGNGHQEG